ncbi:AAA family ATPase [Brevibacillus laterosporus]|uniref:deoxynucleotide monophosphate kinase family protein n=1 Tax=Brevibacillus laterosporus TaxID=1465 RepID=UPI000AE310C5|nr:AAA family ATPase [Brevibacillus laterosporus]
MKIAICGRMRSGKDTVAAYLVEHYDFVPFAFGDGIKRICHELFPEQVANGKKPRALLQGVGQAMRAIDPDVWIKRTMREVNRAHLFDVVITDLRQMNEYDRLRDEGFVIIRINAKDGTRLKRMEDAGDTFTEADLYHETEQYIDWFRVDYDLYNDGSVLDLWEHIECVMREIMRKEAV